MKKRILILFVLAISFCFTTNAQQTKVATVDVNFIISKLPELTGVQSGVEDYSKELEATLKTKLDEYKKKVEDTKAKIAGLSEEDKKKAQEEIVALEIDIQKFRQNGAQLLKLKEDELMRPLYKTIGQAVQELAIANQYTQVFTTNGNEFAYFDRTHDLTERVLTKLGIKLEK